MTEKTHPQSIVVGNNVYELVHPAIQKEVVYKGARYVLALDDHLDSVPRDPKPPGGGRKSVPKVRKLGPPTTQPGGKIDPDLISHPGGEELERKSLERMKGLEDAPVDERMRNLMGLLKDVDDPSMLNSAAYVYHNLPTLSALLDTINSSGLVGFLNNKTRDLTIKLKDSVINRDVADLQEMMENPQDYPEQIEKLNQALYAMYNDVPNLVGASEVLMEAMRVLTNQLVQRADINPRKFKELKAQYKKLIQDLEKFDPSARQSVQKTPAKPPSGKAPRGKKGRNPTLRG